jgi:hypothetical protein
MKKHLVKRGKKIIGFVGQYSNGQWYYAFGKPSADNYIAFHCRSKEAGIAAIEMYQPMGDSFI